MYVGNTSAHRMLNSANVYAPVKSAGVQTPLAQGAVNAISPVKEVKADCCEITYTGNAENKDCLAKNLAAQGAVDEIQDKLSDMSELAARAADENCTDAERAGMQEEVQSIRADINQVSAVANGEYGIAPMSLDGPEAAAAVDTPPEEPVAVNNKYMLESHGLQENATKRAEWTGTADAGQVRDGTTITLKSENEGKAVKFQFVKDATEAVEDGVIKVDISSITDTDKIAEAFTKAVEDNADNIISQLGWRKNLNPELETPADEKKISCSWAQEGSDWKLKLGLSEAWSHDDNKFDVEIDSIRSADINRIPLDDFQTGDIIKVEGLEFKIKLVDSAPGDSDIYNSTTNEISLHKGNLLGSANGSLKKALQTALGSNGYHDVRVAANGIENKTAVALFINATDSNNVSKTLDLEVINKPKVNDAELTSAEIKTPAYIEYSRDINADNQENSIKDGDSFKFRGVRFVFDTDGDTSDTKYKDTSNEKVVHVEAKGLNSSETMYALQDKFNEMFGRNKNAGTGAGFGSSSSGAQASGVQQAFQNVFSYVKAGVFEMRVNVSGGKAAVAIFSSVKKALNEDAEIELKEGEGWETAEEAAEGAGMEGAEAAEGAGAEGAEGTEEISEEAEALAEEAAAIMAVGGDPLIEGMSSEALGIDGVDISTKEGAAEAVNAISIASETVSAYRGSLEETEQQLKADSTSVEGEKITSADKAEETAQGTAEKIEEEPENSMQAQAANIESQVAALLVVS